ncbi:ParA family protein (plasmid) [Rhodovastum atsumiense]|uniref:ParA family protein n=1 Tax=Rhodovastum atsumiense TaxID=504468 RepID=A0A5M6IK61_9PROT|nr:ParA family protein [Rhodovastum atsumiense]KAA5608075.1 ParA family protein [Rhodovastum atsumiense]CAH2606525.1 ParA family protein [Rhodovastum atsumiense]
MFILVAHTPKGGSGKSTLAREVAVSGTMAGLTVALADLDPQGTTSGWFRRRAAEAPVLVRFEPTDTGAELAAAGVDLLVVDTPPGQPPYLRQLLGRADLVLVPVRPTPDDLLGAAPIARSLAGRQWAFVLSQVPARSRLTDSAVRQLAALGRVAPAHLGFRADFPAAAIEGKAAVEFTGKAADEVRDLFAYTQTMMEERNAPTEI